MLIKRRDGADRNIPEDYQVKPAGPGKYIDAEGNEVPYRSIEYKKGQYRFGTLNSDNPVWKFIQELPQLEFDYESISGLKKYMAALAALLPYDDFHYLDTMNLITYAVDRIKELDSKEVFVRRLEALQDVLTVITERVEDPDLQEEIAPMIAIYRGESDGY